ncbi:hypothetical protein D3C75_1115120 [compost metagenome]
MMRSTSAAAMIAEQGMPAIASRVSPVARSNSRATMLRGASMLASKPSGWKCQRITWQALGNVILFMPASLSVPGRDERVATSMRPPGN